MRHALHNIATAAAVTGSHASTRSRHSSTSARNSSSPSVKSGVCLVNPVWVTPGWFISPSPSSSETMTPLERAQGPHIGPQPQGTHRINREPPIDNHKTPLFAGHW